MFRRQIILILLCVLIPALLIESVESLGFLGSNFDVRFHRSAIASGEWWRMLSGHFDHLGWQHLFLNAAFLVLLLFLFQPLERSSLTLLLMITSMLSISVLMWFFSPKLFWYVGLSGSLYSLLVYAIALDRRYPLNFRVLALLVVAAKIVMEQFQFDFVVISEFITGPVAVDAHLYGAIMGAVFVIIRILSSRFFKRAAA